MTFISEEEVITGNGIMFNFYFLPTLFPWCSIEQGIDLAWPKFANRPTLIHMRTLSSFRSTCNKYCDLIG